MRSKKEKRRIGGLDVMYKKWIYIIAHSAAARCRDKKIIIWGNYYFLSNQRCTNESV